MPDSIKYTFREHTGYVLHPNHSGSAHRLLTIGHTASVSPWSDPALHIHDGSEEFYLLLTGELQFAVAGYLVTLQPNEILMVRPQFPHGIIGGEGTIEHLGFRAPVLDDKRVVGDIPKDLTSAIGEDERELRREWGYRIPLEDARNQNCWLLGIGSARYQSVHVIMAYLDFPTAEAANAGIGTRHRLHLHTKSWEYYGVLEGTKSLQVEDEVVTIEPGEILEVPPQVRHTLHERQAPYKGFTLRVPVALHDKVEC